MHACSDIHDHLWRAGVIYMRLALSEATHEQPATTECQVMTPVLWCERIIGPDLNVQL